MGKWIKYTDCSCKIQKVTYEWWKQAKSRVMPFIKELPAYSLGLVDYLKNTFIR